MAGSDVVKRNLIAGDGRYDTIIKVKLKDSIRALEMLAKYHKLLTDVVEVHEDDEAIARLRRARSRAKKANDL